MVFFVNNDDVKDFFVCDFYLNFSFNLPYSIIFNTDIDMVNHYLTESLVKRYWPYVALHVITAINSIILFISLVKVVTDVVRASDAINNPTVSTPPKHPIIFHFNHCRFISKHTFEKKPSRTGRLSATIEHMRSLKNCFFLSALHYCVNILACVTAIVDITSTGIISTLQIYLISASVFLACADVATIYIVNHFSLLQSLIDKNSSRVQYFIFSSVIVFAGMTFIFNALFGQTNDFSTLLESMCALLALTLGDSVKDIFNTMDDKLGKALTSLFVLAFQLSLIPIFMGLMASGFQRAKGEFNIAEKQKAEHVQNMHRQAKAGLRKYKTRNSVQNGLAQEFEERYVEKLARNPHMHTKLMHTMSARQNFNELMPKEQTQISESMEPELPAHIQDCSPNDAQTNEGLNRAVDREIRKFMVKRLRKKSEGSIRFDEFYLKPVIDINAIQQSMSATDDSVKSITFEIATLVKYNFYLLKKYFTEFGYVRDKEKFSFVLVIASSELADNFLHNLKLLRHKLNKLHTKKHKNKSSISTA